MIDATEVTTFLLNQFQACESIEDMERFTAHLDSLDQVEALEMVLRLGWVITRRALEVQASQLLREEGTS